MLSSCGYDSDYKTPDEKAIEMQNNIIACFINHDEEKLKKCFCFKVQKQYQLTSQIQYAFDYIDGEIVSYEEPDSRVIGPIEEKEFGATTKKVITDKGTEYKISFSGMERMDSNPQQEGVTYIKVINMTLADPLPNDQKEQYIIYIGEHD